MLDPKLERNLVIYAGEISVRSSTKIGFTSRSYLWRFLLRRNDILNENIIMKMIALAPIEVKILLWRSRGFGSHKRLERPEASVAGLAPEKKIWFYHRNRMTMHGDFARDLFGITLLIFS